MFKALKDNNPFTSFRSSMTLAFGIAMLVLTGLLSVVAGQASRHSIQKNISDHMATTASQLADKLDRGMFERYRDTQVAATILQLQRNNLSLDEKRELIEVLQNTFPDYSWIGLTNPEGQVLVSTGRVLEGADVSERPWFIHGRNEPFLGDVHEALLLAPLVSQDSDEPLRLVDIALPLRHTEDGELEGVLGVHLNWQWAREVHDSLLTSRMVDEQIQLFIVDANGVVLLGPEGFTLETIPPAVFSEANLNADGMFIAEWDDGNQYLTGFAHSTSYRSYPGLGWLVVVRQPTTVAFAPARELSLQILILGAGIGVVFVGIGWLLAGRMAEPIQRIVQASQAIQQGELSTPIPQLDNNAEIASLSEALRDMVAKLTQEIAERRKAQASLKALNVALETQVTERTAELTAANERLKQLNIMKTNLISDVSHELRNPIASLMMRIYLLEKQPEKYEEHIKVLKEASARLGSLVDNILDVSRLELGKGKFELVACDLNQITHQAVEIYKPQAELKDITLTFSPDESLPPVKGNPSQLGQVVTNLVVNAINYTKQGHIKAKTVYDVDKQRAGLIVEDTGIGIAPDDIEHLFERFFRGKQVAGSAMSGTGLGLSIVKEIVTIHNGEIEVDGTLDQGTTFRIWFPV